MTVKNHDFAPQQGCRVYTEKVFVFLCFIYIKVLYVPKTKPLSINTVYKRMLILFSRVLP